MGKVTGFLEFERLEEPHEGKDSRKKHYREFYLRLPDEDAKVQGARCMDCGIPFCMQGCPVNNIIPDFNDLIYRQDWERAIETLHSTNNFPEFGTLVGAPLKGRVLIVDDVMSAGTATRESIALIKAAGATPAAVAIALDRQEKATEKDANGNVVDVPYSAVQFVRNQLGMQVCTIASLKDLLDYLATTADPSQQVHEAAIKAYRDRYGV